jgi:putative tRNA adenosine deaminase-associated protein
VAEDTLVDFAVVVFREDGQWQVGSLPHRAATELPALLHAVRQQPSEGPTIAICSYGDDFFLVIRPDGDDVRLMISDATAAGDWPVAREALDLVDEPQPEDDEAAAPAGDLDIFADLGIDSMELVAMCSDLEAYPDEILGQVAARLGFGPQFESVVDDDLT